MTIKESVEEEEKFTPYPCDLVINDRPLNILEISNHIWEKKGREKITPKLIQTLIKKLDNRSDKKKRFIPEGEKDGWEYFKVEPLRDEKEKPYKLIWCWLKEGGSFLRIRTFHRTKKKYDKKN